MEMNIDKPVSIVWFRQDLRLSDHPALDAARERGGPVVPVYIWAPEEEGDWAPGEAARWWLHQSLISLDESLRGLNSRLIIRQGKSLELLTDLVDETGARSVFWNRRYEPMAVKRDRIIESELRKRGIEVRSFVGCLLHDPEITKTREGKPYKVFTPFWKACQLRSEPAEPIPAPKRIILPSRIPLSEGIESLNLSNNPNQANGSWSTWQPGEEGAFRELDRFLDNVLLNYVSDRNRPDIVGTSRLSPHLHHGEISPRKIWHVVNDYNYFIAQKNTSRGMESFIRQLYWREFAYHLLYHYPHTPSEPMHEHFRDFPWIKDFKALEIWQLGRTGYPIVDAAMRELRATGWMHNRMRMVVASFLTKDLMIDWREGARWFWNMLVDGDLANNTFGWQWTAGCGADASPFFRIFNPVKQGETFDPEGDYVRRWIPELKRLPNKFIHKPWKASDHILNHAKIELGDSYPQRIIDHSTARLRTLNAYHKLKQSDLMKTQVT
jgi:deoxyribodipyrimidine photo-lyase